MKLYHYVHCPFCIRLRMVLGYLNLDYESIVLPYNDEKTPLHLTGVKMLPIMEIGSAFINESLDIISKLDKEDKLKTQHCIQSYHDTEVHLNRLGNDIHSLAMPYFIWTPEFDQESRQYFQNKKEKKRGPFKELVHKRKQFEAGLHQSLNDLNNIFNKDITQENIDLTDILYASHLWAMYIVPEFQFPNQIHQWLQNISKVCHFNYHGPYWSE